MSYSSLRRIRIALLVLAAVAGVLPGAAWAAGPSQASNFHTITSCRLYDTRAGGTDPNNPLVDGQAARLIQVTGVCGVPADAKSVLFSVTVAPTSPPGSGMGELFLYASDEPTPSVGTPFHVDKLRTKSEIVKMPADVSGKIAASAITTPTGQSVHLILDVDGYFMDSAQAVNDVATVNEDSGATTIDVRLNDNGPPSGAPFTIGSVTQPANGAVVITNAGADLTYEPDPDYCNNGSPTDNFTYTLTPGNSTATVAVAVTCVNDAPAGTDNTVSTPEDTDYVFAAADFGFTDPLDSPANALLAVKVTTLPALGSLTLSGGAVTAGQSIAVADLTASNLKFTPAVNGNGSPYTSFTFQVQDDGGMANGGVDLDASANTLTINVTGVNNPPAGTDGSISTPEDTQYTFTAADFGFTDPLDTPPDSLASVVITTLPGLGSLTLSGAGFAAGTEIAVADINAGNLKYSPVADAFGSPYTTFTFQVRDDGGTAGGGVDLDASANTLTINVTAVNDPPAGADKTVSTSEDVQYTFTAADFGFTDPIDSPANALQAVKITTLPAAGTLTLSGSGFAAGTDISVANITAGNLKFTPAANAVGSPYTTFTFQVRDDGGTASGGVDLDPTPNTITVDVTAVNDAPAGTNGTVNTLEETQYTFTTADFGFTDPNDTPANALAAVVITTLPGAGTLTLSGSGFAAGTEISAANITAGNLKFMPAANGSGSPYTTFTFQVRDDGGTAGGGVDLDASPNTMTINVNGINDAPAGTDGTVNAVEDTQYTFTVADFGFTDPNDTPANALASVVITTLPGAGTLTLSGSGFAAGTEISAANITAGNLKFTPAANASGSPYTSFTFQVRDDGGTANSGVDLDASANTLTINVAPVNDAPAGTNNTVAAFEDAQYTFTAADFGFTDPNDTPSNTLLSVVITTLPGAGTLTLSGSGFAAGTEISLANINGGNLKFTPAANGSGSPYATFTFQVRDNGGTASGGVDLDPSANTMTINVTAVNDAPAGTNGTVATAEDTQYTFTTADFGFTDPNDSPANALASVVITTLPGVGTLTLSGSGFAAGTEITAANITAGNLKFTPAANGSGSPYTTFTFQVRDDGGTANGGVNLDPTPNTMTVNVTAVNDAPAGTNNTVAAFEDTQYTFTAANFGFTDPNDSPANTLASVIITTLPGTGTLTLSGSGFAAGTEIPVASINAGNLKFLAAPNAFGSPYTTFTFQVRDDGGTAGGGVDLDPSANTLTINVTAVNDAPAGTNNTATTPEDIQYTFSAADFGFTDPNDSPANALASVVITTLPGAGSLTLSGSPFAAGTEILLANIPNLKFQGAANAFGSPYTSFTFQVRDDGGTAGGGVNLDPTPNTITINVTPVNDAPVADLDVFDYLGNTELRVDRGTVATPHLLETTPSTFGAVDGDSDPVEGDAISVSAITVGSCTDNSLPLDCTDPAVGTVHMQSNGQFTFEPAPGDTGSALVAGDCPAGAVDKETFQYTLTDNGTPLAASTTGTVRVCRFERIWYVDPSAGAGNGTSASPYNTLDSLDGVGGAGDSDVAGDYIFVHDGSLTLSAVLEMEANQHLIGEGTGLSFPLNLNGNGSPTVLVPAGVKPQLTFAGDAVKVGAAIPVRIVGLSLASTLGNAIDLTSTGVFSGSATLTIDNNEIRNATAEGVDINLNAGTNGTLAVDFTNNTWNLAGTHTGNSFDARTASATANLRVNFSNNTNVLTTASGAAGVFLDGSGGGTLTVTGFANNSVHQNTAGSGVQVVSAIFDSNTGTAGFQQVSGGTTVIGTSGNGVGAAGMSLTNVQGNLFYTDLDIFADNGLGLRVSGTGGGMTFGTSAGVAMVEATNGPAVDVTSVALTLPLSSLKSTNSTTTGVALNTITGTFSAGSGSSITGSTGTGFQVGSSNATVSYAGTVTTTAGKGVDLTSNTGSTLSFTGTLSLSSGGTTAFNATGGGTVSASDTASTLTSSTGTALNVASTTIGASGLKFRSISAGTPGTGPTNGIVLNNTGSSGGLSVTGTAAASSGGTIQNTTGAGISLTNTRSVSLNRMNLQSIGDSGVNGAQVTNFTFTNGTINNVGNAGEESAIAFNGSGSNTGINIAGTLVVTGNTFTNPFYSGIDVQNDDGVVTSATISNNIITNPGFSGVNLVGNGSATTAFTLNNASINQNNISSSGSNGIQLSGGNGNAAGPRVTLGIPNDAGNVISITNNAISLDGGGTQAITAAVTGANSGQRTRTNFDISNNGTAGAPITGSLIGTVVLIGCNGHSDCTGLIHNNVIDANHTAGPGGGGGNGIGGGNGVGGAGSAWTPNLTLTVTNNVITDVNGNGILLVGRGATGTLKLKIANNNVQAPNNTPGGSARQGIRVDAGNAASADDAVYLNIFGNTSTGSNAAAGLGVRKQGTVSTTNDFGVFDAPGGSDLPAVPTTTDVQNFINALNPSGGGTDIISGSNYQEDLTQSPP
jgi:hypothetical protein